MSTSRFVAVRCRIFAGGFSGERVVRITTAEGKEHVSLAPQHYCWKEDNTIVGEDEPEGGQHIDGLVAAHLIETQEGNKCLLSLPDGKTVLVKKSIVRPRPEETHVPV